jgi:hypothetical protein
MSRELGDARKNKNDEFYTVYEYIQKEVNAYLEYNPETFKEKIVFLPCDDPEWSNFTRFFAQNFENLGLKKLISTSFSTDSKKHNGYQFTLEDFLTDYEKTSPQFDENKTATRGKIFVLERDTNGSGNIDIKDLKWTYLEGDGDFRSDEVKALRDEADIIVTNPPFSLFREFVAWIMEADKKCLIIGSQNAVTYKEIFPLIKDNKFWIGATCNSEDMVFRVPHGATINPKDKEKAAKLGFVGNYTRLGNANWFTNIEHGRRHQPLSLMTQSDNLKFSKHKDLREVGYHTYDNFNAIEVSYLDAIPSDYEGIMGVPITFLSKYCPEQFEILGFGAGELGTQAGVRSYDKRLKPLSSALRDGIPYIYDRESNTVKVPYARIFIRKRV